MKNVLLDKGIILPSGEISKDKVNLVTGAITQPFAEMVWVTTGGDMETVNRLTDVLVTMNTPADRGKLFKIIKMLYGLMGFPFSEEAEPMDADPAVLEYFIFSFTADFGEVIQDLIAEEAELIPKPSKSRFYCVTGMQQRSDEAMAVFRVERNKGYTVMSNHHLRNKELSLKAKGLLSQMLSLPEDWDYTLAGLSFINREKIDAIREAIKELERAGYIVRSRERDEKGRLRGTDYVILEQPQPPPVSDLPTLENPTLDNPTLEKPTQEKPTLENPTQLNKDILSKEQSITDLSSTDSIPFHSLNPLPFAHGEAATPPERKRTEAKSNSAVEIYREIIKDNIEYDHLIQNCKIDKDRLDEIVDLMLETVCTARKTIRIAGDDYPAELVKSKFLKLNSSHIEFVLDCMRENTTKVRNIKQYLKAVLFNAPSTIDSYYTALVNHDLYGGE